jgi:chromosome segregation protein
VELERATTREIANQERIAELKTRAAAGTAELEQARLHLQGLIVERESHRSFLETAATEAAGVREESRQRQEQAREAAEAVNGAEQRLEAARRYAMQLLTQAGHARNQTMQAEESLAALEQDAERLAAEIAAASGELASLGSERGQASLRFESVTEQLQRLENELSRLRADTETRRNEESETKLNGDRLRAEMATLTGRRNSLQSLIREHSYSTDTVRKLLKSNSLGGGLAPVGTLADFLEVSGEYETVVDAFLRDELNYIVVTSWDAAHEGMRLLKSDVDGRATFLVHPDDSQAKFSFAGDTLDAEHNSVGVVRLKRLHPGARWLRPLAGSDSAQAARWLRDSRRRAGKIDGPGKSQRVLPGALRRVLSQRHRHRRQAQRRRSLGVEGRAARNPEET